MEYRIKEVTIPLKSGVLKCFYPQVNFGETKKTTGYLWWKKSIMQEGQWCNFYRDESDNYLYVNKNHFSTLLYFSTIEEAQKIIEEHKSVILEQTREIYSKAGIEWTDDRYVKIHPTT